MKRSHGSRLIFFSPAPMLPCSHALLFSLLLCFPSVVNAQWEPDVRLTYNDSASYTSYNNAWCVAATGDTVHVTWFDKRDRNEEIYYRHSYDGGVLWGTVTRLTNDPFVSRFPCIGVVDSFVHVVWCDTRDGNYFKIYYKRSSDGGQTWGSDTRLTNDTASLGFPSLTVNGSNVHIVWMDDRDSPLNNQEIYYKRSTDAGSTWGPDTRLTFDPYSSNFPSVATNGLDVHVVWMDTRNDVYSIFYKRSTDTGTTWGPDTLLANTSNIMTVPTPSVAVSGQDIHVVWRDGGIIYKRSTDRGASWWPDTSLASSVFLLENPSIATSGPYVHVVWDGELVRNVEIYYKRSTDAGSTWEPDTRLTNDTASSAIPSVAVSRSMVHVVWTDRRDGNTEVYYKRNPSGNSGVEEVTFPRLTPYASRITVSPNPFTSFTSVPNQGADLFTLYDISGRMVGVFKGDRIGEGLSSGVYFLRAEGKYAKPLRIVKLR
jgi:hypothetical protein